MTTTADLAQVDPAIFHPAAQIFPMMSDRELLDLVDDIREHGLREPVWLHRDGRIIDGRNRYIACRSVGVAPQPRTFEGTDAELIPFVVSLNLHRRHLNESQRAMVAARIAQLPVGANQHEGAQICAPSQAEAAAMLNVGRRSVQAAKKVQDQGAPELAAAVDSGDLAVSAAASVIDQTQERLAGLPPAEAAQVVRDVIAEKREAIAAAQSRADEIRRHNEWVRDFNETVDPAVIAYADEIGRRVDAVTRIADGCEDLLRAVVDVDPERAVHEAHESNRDRLRVVADALAFLTRVHDAMTSELVAE